MLVPDGSGVNAVPVRPLSNRYLTMAYLSGANLMNVSIVSSNLDHAELSGADLWVRELDRSNAYWRQLDRRQPARGQPRDVFSFSQSNTAHPCFSHHRRPALLDGQLSGP